MLDHVVVHLCVSLKYIIKFDHFPPDSSALLCGGGFIVF